MSRKKTAPAAEPANRPVILGFLILAAGGYSTWYWYKPLPDLTQSVTSSPWDQNRTDEWNWTDSAVLRPTMEELQSSAINQEPSAVSSLNSPSSASSSIANAPPPELPRTKAGLIAAPDMKWQLNTATEFDPPPSSPDIPISDETIVGTVKPWVDYDNLPSNSIANIEYKWPTKQSSTDVPSDAFAKNGTTTRAILSSGSMEQPTNPRNDLTNQTMHRTNPQATLPLPSSPSGFGPPKLLDSPNQRIAVPDDDGQSPLPRSGPPTEFTVTPQRTPQFIRQPK